MESNAELSSGVVIFAIIRVYFESALMIHYRPLKFWLARGNRVVLRPVVFITYYLSTLMCLIRGGGDNSDS